MNWELGPLANKVWVPPIVSLGVHLGFVGDFVEDFDFSAAAVWDISCHRQRCSAAAQHSYSAAGKAQQADTRLSWCRTPLCACRQGVGIRDLDMKKSSSRVAYACGPGARASQRVLVVELISTHASMTPARNMPAAPFISVRNCCSCGLSKKGSGAKSVVVGAQGASKARTAKVDVDSLVSGLGALRVGLAAQ